MLSKLAYSFMILLLITEVVFWQKIICRLELSIQIKEGDGITFFFNPGEKELRYCFNKLLH